MYNLGIHKVKKNTRKGEKVKRQDDNVINVPSMFSNTRGVPAGPLRSRAFTRYIGNAPNERYLRAEHNH